MECTNLLALPEDMLYEISCYVGPYERFCLWRVSKRARFLLQERSVLRYLSVCYDNRILRFPTFTLNLKTIKTLKFERGHEDALGITWRELEALPPSLTCLSLRAKDTFQIFFKGANSICPMKSDRDMRTGREKYYALPRKAVTAKLKKLLGTMLRGNPEDMQHVVDLSKVTPKLQQLTLSGRGTQAGFNLISKLPDSITHLTVSGDYNETGELCPKGDYQHKFPASLTLLHIDTCNNFSAFHLLPPGLTHLRLNEGCTTSNIKLPPSLLRWEGSLALPDPTLPDPFGYFSSDLSTALSQTTIQPTTSASYSYVTSTTNGAGSAQGSDQSLVTTDFSNWSFLPSSLTSFDMASIKGPGLSIDTILKYTKERLPSLTKLTIRSSGGNSLMTDKLLELLPQGLQELSFVAGNQITSNFYGLIPRRVTDLCVYRSYLSNDVNLPNDDPAIGNLPPGLTRLYLFIHRYLPESIVALLPRSLTILSPSAPRWTTRAHVDPPVTSLSYFPPKLTEFIVDRDIVIPFAVFSTLPSSVHSITVHEHREFGNEFIQALPSTITYLRMVDSDQVTDEGMKHLPPKLENLDMSRNMRVTDEGLLNLPITLRYLELKGSDKITGKIVKHLPRGLLRLTLRYVGEWTDDDIKFLPPEMDSLALHRCNGLTDACFPFLPRTLSTFTCKSNRNFTPAILKHLPYYLNDLNLKHNRNFNKSHYALIPHGMQFYSRGLHVSGD